MNNELKIRLATIDDAGTLVQFNQAMASETEGKELTDAVLRPGVEGLFARPEYGFYLIAEPADGSGDPAGSLMVTYEWSDWRNGLFWWIQSVYVTPDWRRRGVYTALYDYVKELASAENICGFRLYVEKDNVAAQQTYKRLGMAETHYLMFESGNRTESDTD